MTNSEVLNSNTVNISVTGINTAGPYEDARCYLTVSNDNETHTVVLKKNSKGHWEMESRREFPDWVLELEANYVRVAKEEEQKTNQQG